MGNYAKVIAGKNYKIIIIIIVIIYSWLEVKFGPEEL